MAILVLEHAESRDSLQDEPSSATCEAASDVQRAPPGIVECTQCTKSGPSISTMEETISKSNCVLLVEVHPDTRLLTRRLLELCGLHVVHVDGADLALSALAKQPVDLLICDLELLGTDGSALLARVRKETSYEKLPAIALCRFPFNEDCARARDGGFDHVLIKPLYLKPLRAAVQDLLGERRIEESPSQHASDAHVVPQTQTPAAAVQVEPKHQVRSSSSEPPACEPCT